MERPGRTGKKGEESEERREILGGKSGEKSEKKLEEAASRGGRPQTRGGRVQDRSMDVEGLDGLRKQAMKQSRAKRSGEKQERSMRETKELGVEEQGRRVGCRSVERCSAVRTATGGLAHTRQCGSARRLASPPATAMAPRTAATWTAGMVTASLDDLHRLSTSSWADEVGDTCVFRALPH